MSYLKISYSEFKAYKESSGAPIDFIENTRWYFLYLTNGNFSIECEIEKFDPVVSGSDQEDFETNYKNLPETNSQTTALSEIVDQTPFAKPIYRTKRESNGLWVTCPADTVTSIDYLVSEERYATGGEVIYKNAKEGDWVSACVYDKDGVIPEAYRPTLCEAWPVVAEYIVQKFLLPTETDKYGNLLCDTYPLSAKITTGLYLRVNYHASSVAGDRKAIVNYNLNKKL